MDNYSDISSGKDINYLSKDFNSFKQNLVEYVKSYYPGTYKDFSENSTGMMFIELASYVGDVLSYYVDYQFKEGFMQYASERNNVVTLANYLGYKPKPSTAATTELDVMQLVPSKIGDDGRNVPDMKFALNIRPGMEVLSDGSGTVFRTLDSINFAEEDPTRPTEIQVFQRDGNGQPTFYLLKKTLQASAGTVKEMSVPVGEPEEFFEVEIPDTNVLEVESVTDSNGNKWNEVPYLSQDTVLIDEPNSDKYSPHTSQYANLVPYILRYLKTSKRFTTAVNSDNTTTLEFGQGRDRLDEELITPSLDNVGRTVGSNKNFDIPYDPSNFLKTDSYGESPANTTLTIKYYAGGGLDSNVKSNSLTRIAIMEFNDTDQYLSPTEQNILTTIKSSVTVNNPNPALGGRDAESIDEIRIKGLASFSSQNRAVTRDDYVIRAYSMPTRYGSIAKAFVTKDGILDTKSQLDILKSTGELDDDVIPSGMNTVYGEINNPFAVNLYVLSFDDQKKLTNPNKLVLENLSTYLSQYRLVTDGLNITSAFVINIGAEFEISVFHNYNKKEVLYSAISVVRDFFEIDKWQISQPIELGSLELAISKVSGVKSISKLEIKNLTVKDGNYSENEYDIKGATINKMLYPSMDPSIFELKFPGRDIVGRVV
jgi:hypothetical protein